ncbi:MAG: lysophospholipid acyltransferase family protein [Propionibacteriaceae bacterium]|nr:1-acyl-sn-glycerol-3-phosphate acyltransferase [Micropruina sp.]HBX81144.1 1-acyl-sn-glycerol-3-phosphate acyltransferase [Propionibacteriaceae bacterium]HBY23633.1 1-acyl-sn-glycerol-3-phosphate acyltransferase [Propionibacteriaceae bacterium]
MIQPYDGRAKRPLRKVNHEDATPFYGRIAKGFGWLMRRTSKQDWGPMDAIPETGPLLVCPNHISNYDPPAIGHFLMWSGRFPYYLAKEEVFKVPFVGWVARGCDMIPVARHSSQAAEALVAAKKGLDQGKCMVIYPEGKRTRDPELWPMTGRNGAARLALTTRTPVIPVGQWGAQEVMPPGEKGFHFIPRRTMHVMAGPPVELSDLYSDNPNGAALNEATKRIMDAITTLVIEVRGEPAPEGRWDTRAGARI